MSDTYDSVDFGPVTVERWKRESDDEPTDPEWQSSITLPHHCGAWTVGSTASHEWQWAYESHKNDPIIAARKLAADLLTAASYLEAVPEDKIA